ncbi:MAG: adenylosuccinate synthase [bacterium]|nr:adenylosuccinate synthase [bacterium]MDZ4285938.1 adenylosuccinate synthase [Candidatus Sungbacteria bacterium]
MPVTILNGAQWGDEGKGKITDVLAQSSHVVARWAGGNNAGHSIMSDEYGNFVLHVVPAGILNPDALCLIERGVVVHPPSLVDEMNVLKERHISLNNLTISPYAHIVMPWHIVEDQGRERGIAIGTTLRGIGPCYQDKIGRWHALRIGNLRNKRTFFVMLEEIYAVKQAELKAKFPSEKNLLPDFDVIKVSYAEAREQILPFIGDTTSILHRCIRARKNILLEGAQGTLLDVDFGTYPYVTSSNTVSMAACLLTAISPKDVDRIIGVAKAYVTRVGEGPFPTEIKGKEHDELQRAGHEFGATTGRPRRCGWFDAPLMRYAAAVNHYTELALTKLDILGLLESIYVCNTYRNGGKTSHLIDMFDLADKKPEYMCLGGWGSLGGARFRDELPDGARVYIKKIEEYVGVPVRYISIGGKRKEIITL